jgi:hypothetical protein
MENGQLPVWVTGGWLNLGKSKDIPGVISNGQLSILGQTFDVVHFPGSRTP